jgi:surfeit locus 1 family protein
VSRRILFFTIFALTVSLGCVRLGFWQVSRLRERQARNALVLSRLEAPPQRLVDLPRDTAVRFRRATAQGRYDFAHELIYAVRPRDGAPGVNILTPLVIGRGDTAILVNRGWVYSPNGMSIDLAQWREVDSERVQGFVEEYVKATAAVATSSVEKAVRRLDRDSLQARLPYVLYPLILVQQDGRGNEATTGTPVRIAPPPLSEGSHRSYAIQWFGFAITGIVGTVLVVARERRRMDPKPAGHESPAPG